MKTLFQPYRLNDTLTLANRFMMAPLTRCMAGPGLVPTEQMAAYYARRADIGLIISEATIILGRAGLPQYPGDLQRRADSRLEESDRRRACQRRQDLRPAVARGSSIPPLLPPRRSAGPSAVAHEGTVPACASWSIRCRAP